MAEKKPAKRKRKNGRPTKLNPQVQAKICDLILAGNYPDVAAGACGIGRATYYAWMQKGDEQKTGIYSDFRDAILKARQESEAHLIALVRKASIDSWQAAAWMLERTRKGRYSKPLNIEQSSTASVTIEGADWLTDKAKGGPVDAD